jgi:hypothetical protein
MNPILIILGLFFGLSFFSSILVLGAWSLSSRASQELEPFEPPSYRTRKEEKQYEPALVREVIISE